MEFPQIKQAIDQTAAAFAAFSQKTDAERAALLERIEAIEAARLSPGGGVATKGGGEYRMLHTVSGDALPWLRADQKAVDFYRSTRKAGQQDEEFSIAEYARAAVLGAPEGRKIASGTATVPTMVGSRIIDLVRAQSVLARAGAGTILIDGPTNLARITGDATVIQHTEAANDVTESDITVAAVALNPKSLVANVPLTVELVQDSPNLDAVLQTSMAGAFALKLDALGITKILADAGVTQSLVAHDPATWTGTNAAIAIALAANQNLPTAHISTPANFAARSAILASTAGSWIGKPPYLAAMQELFTTSMSTDVALFGQFDAGVAVALRQNLTLEIVRHGKPATFSHLLVAYMRAEVVVLAPGRLYEQRKVP